MSGQALAAVRTGCRTLSTLALLSTALPANLVVTAAALVRPSPAPPPRPAAGRRTVLISGGKMTKALALARNFSSAGHRVILVESGKYRRTGHRFSRAVDRFYTVPDPTAPDYAAALLGIVQREQVDVYLPVCSPVASLQDARAKDLLSPACEVFSADADLVEVLDDKHRFAELAASLGLGVPRSHRITSHQQLTGIDLTDSPHGYLLKSIRYDAAGRLEPVRLTGRDPVREQALVRSLPISPAEPWVLQEFIAGQEYCTHSTVRQGRVQMYACCASSAFQLNYAMADVPQIEAWVRHFVGELGLTGQLAFDFIQAKDGLVYAIECNPRTHSAVTMFYDHPEVADAYLRDRTDCLLPLPTSRPTYWLYHELWGLLQHPASLPSRLRTIRHGKDAVFDWADPLPFLFLHHLQIPDLLLQDLRRAKRWIRIDFNIGKLVEASGD